MTQMLIRLAQASMPDPNLGHAVAKNRGAGGGLADLRLTALHMRTCSHDI